MFESYLEPIFTAVIAFPFIAAIFTIPYIVYCYHKYGSFISFRIIIVYSMILYLISAYFLIILPLPSFEDVANITSQRAQLIPFHFVIDVIQDIRLNSGVFKLRALLQVIFNIVLTVPFGFYLHYYFKCSLKKTIILSFCLSLFFELTQLTGLYFIYERPYRLFDLDDLLFNTLGGLVGYYLVNLVDEILPTREVIDFKAYQDGRKITWMRRLTTIICDLIIVSIISYLITNVIGVFLLDVSISSSIVGWLYLIICSYYCKGSTLGMKITSVKMIDIKKENIGFKSLIIKYTSMMFIYVWLPYIIITVTGFLKDNNIIEETIYYASDFIIIIYWCVLYLYSFFLLLKSKALPHEKLSGLKIISNVKEEIIKQ